MSKTTRPALDAATLDFDRGEASASAYDAAAEERSERCAYQDRPVEPLSEDELDRLLEGDDYRGEQ